MAFEELIGKAVDLIISSKYMTAFTGAGVSAESGIPTFRGENGLWRKYRVEDLATLNGFKRNPRLVWEWYRWRLDIVFNAKPNPAHIVLARLEEMNILKCIITQNVDDLHRVAGSKCIVELHGNIKRARCIECGYKIVWEKPPDEIPPHCPRCNGLLRPDVVWFGEPLPSSELSRAIKYAEKTDLLLVIGTSGIVYPAAWIPYIVKENGGKIIEINIEETVLTPIADISLRGKAGEIMEKLYKEIMEKRL